MSAYFITGTGTDIGKTWLTCALLRHWRAAGQPVQAYKPVLSGFDMATAEASDAGQILAALGRTMDVAALDEIAPWRFAAPLSPDMAATREGRAVDFDALVAFTRRCLPAKRHSRQAGHASTEFPMLVEGVGGVMVPLDAQHTVRDWIAASDLPCVLVAGSYLGSLSHTLTALESLKKVGAGVTAIVVNESPDSSVSLDETLTSLHPHVGDVPLLGIDRAYPASGVAALAEILR
ncbi:MAG: dethiobiotin synthetase [Rugosibacter sp.]|jgi:dethiobiotin synthetase|nr:dethiobiotin synthetase [Rugosibacter sp.]